MKPFSIGQVVAAAGGQLISGDPDSLLTSIAIDSRKVLPGSLFVPLIGSRVNGHDFIESAIQNGARAVISSQPKPGGLTLPGAWIKVHDTLQALQDIARSRRDSFTGPVVGVTGSVGKTSTKDMVACALSSVWEVMKSAGNMNSQVGLPLSLLELEDRHQAGVFEMGMSEFGEMRILSLLARPDIAVITNIGVSHIEQLGSRENIMREKLSIAAGMKETGILILNGDEPLLAQHRGQLPQKTLFFGQADWCDYRAEEIRSEESGTSFMLKYPGEGSTEVSLSVPGKHNVYNALAALAVAHQCGIDPEIAAAALAHFAGEKMRLQLITCGDIILIDDTYNASPDSMNAALTVLAQLGNVKRRIAVLADMFELGALSYQSHYDLGQAAAAKGIDLLLTVGQRAAWIADGAEASAGKTQCERFSNNQEVLTRLQQLLQSGDAILIKGSRGMHCEEIVAGIRAILNG